MNYDHQLRFDVLYHLSVSNGSPPLSEELVGVFWPISPTKIEFLKSKIKPAKTRGVTRKRRRSHVSSVLDVNGMLHN
jgi:hypothetical protein